MTANDYMLWRMHLMLESVVAAIEMLVLILCICLLAGVVLAGLVLAGTWAAGRTREWQRSLAPTRPRPALRMVADRQGLVRAERHPLVRTILLLGATLPASAAHAQAARPTAPERPVTDTIFGVAIDDPYRWMETDTTELRGWLLAQGRTTRERLDAVPGREEHVRRVTALLLEQSDVFRVRRAGDRLFFLRTSPGSSLPQLVVHEPDGAERVLVDAGAPATDGSHASIDNFAASADGRLVAVNRARGGAEITGVAVLESSTGTELPDRIDRIWGEFEVYWLPDGTGFFYTQMAEPSAAPGADPMLGMRVRFHRLGTVPAEDPVVIAPDAGTLPLDRHEFPWVRIPAGGDVMLAFASGARRESRLCIARLADVLRRNPSWQCVADYDDLVEDAVVHGDALFLLTTKDAPNGRVIRVPVGRPALDGATIVIPESVDRVITGIDAARDALYVTVMQRGSDRVLRLPWGDQAVQELPAPLPAPTLSVAASTDQAGVIVSAENWTQPRTWYAWDPAAGHMRDLGLRTGAVTDRRDVVVESVEARSHDGAMVPLSIVHAGDLARDGSSPTLLLGYAGYGFVMQPTFFPELLQWLDRGGIFATCGARGGGEKGRAWYVAGKGPNKGNGVRDFIACAEYLSANGYSQPARIAAAGQSMGGVLVGGAITERPDAFGAAVIGVGILNPVRILEGVNGANQVPELGDPRTEEGFRSLLAMDPYHRIRDGVDYPAVLLTIGLNDNRVSPWHTGKFAARLQAASTSGRPVLIRTDEDAGHMSQSLTREQQAAETADTFAFIAWQLGLAGSRPRR